MSEIDNSLKRLGTEYVDLYIIHRWDYNTPIEETMEAMHDVVKSGKARYIGASAMYAWLLQKVSVAAPIVGATKIAQLEDSVDALSVKLNPEEISFLEELYVPHPIVGAQ